MKRNMILLILLIAGTALLPSCVAKKKYLAAQDRISGLQADSLRQVQQIQELDGRVSKMQEENRFTSSQLDKSQEALATERERLEQLQRLIEQQQQNTEALRKKIADALVNFSASQLTVSMKNGKVYVSMQESLLFPSGSAEVNSKGKEALARLSDVLNQNPDINVEVEGHTDTVPISIKFQDNWALSVARSTAIARIMIREYSVHPTRITATGRGDFDPVDTNETPEGRQRNRRTEIILEPKLDELMQLIGG
jgi:chemotaxis protein MotB